MFLTVPCNKFMACFCFQATQLHEQINTFPKLPDEIREKKNQLIRIGK